MTEFEHNFDWLVGEIDKAKEKARALFSKCNDKIDANSTPVLITIDRMQNSYTITGSTYATLLDDFKIKNIILKDDLALSIYTVKVTSINGLANDNTYKLIYLSDGVVVSVSINKDGSITE